MKLPAVLLLLLCLLPAGCASPEALTRQLRVGMTKAEVRALMGQPYATSTIVAGEDVGVRWEGLVWKYHGVRVMFQQHEPQILRAWVTGNR